ncbi:MAG: hypothetical protein ACI351_05095 [Candidatus Avelusimicrobium sp.]|uniref:hypothetical protein n=1 Tax=Candidatus Avelusimicrobium sp. TaxID=3048833 RepID=UPI003F10A236
MKKLFTILVFISILYMPAVAEIALRMDGDEIVLSADSDCEIQQFIQATEKIDNNLPSEITADPHDTFSTDEVTQKIIPNMPFISSAAFARVSDSSITNADLPDEFDEIKLDIIRDVKAVNWKTGYNITARDLTFWNRLAFVCGRVTKSMPIPSVATIGIPSSLISDEEVHTVTDASVQKLAKTVQYSIMDSKLKTEVRYTPEGLYFAILTKNPFLLLTIDDDIYATLEQTEMQILTQYGRTKDDRLLGILFQNMHKFFDLRHQFENINPRLRSETNALLRMSHFGAGDAWSTYKLLADHTIIMSSLLDQHILNEDYEENTFLALKKLFMQIGDDVKKHHLQEHAIRKDPANTEMVQRVDNEYKHKQHLKENALRELENTDNTDKELLLRAYKKD